MGRVTREHPADALTAVVLAGGRSRRLGRDKALLELNGFTLLERVVAAARTVTNDVLIVGRVELPDKLVDVPTCADAVPGTGPLGGLVTGLQAAISPRVLVLACDLPFLSPTMLGYLAHLPCQTDAIVPRLQGRAQPLHAIYQREILAVAQVQLRAGEFRLQTLLSRLQVRWVDEDELRSIDPLLCSFTNVNLPVDWHRLKQQMRTQP